MDEIVERVRSRGGDRSPSIPRARRCARARPAEGRWAERMDGLICLQRETDRFAEEWERTREPGAEGVPSSQSRPCEPRWPTSASARSRWRRRTSAVSRSRSPASPTGSASSVSRRWPMCRARRAGRARGRMTHAERVETVRRAFEGQSSLGAQTRRRRRPGGPPPLPRTLPSPCRSRRPIRLPPPLPRIHLSPRRSRRPIRLPRRGAGCVGRARGARYMGRAQGAGCRAETAGGGEAALADRPSLLPLGVERTGVRRGAPPPLQPGTRCRRHNHAIWSERKDTPTSPQPSPPLIHFPQAPGARSASLAFAPCGARGRRGRTGGAVYVPSPPFRGERDRERWVCCLRGALRPRA